MLPVLDDLRGIDYFALWFVKCPLKYTLGCISALEKIVGNSVTTMKEMVLKENYG